MRIKIILTLTLTLGPRHTFSFALGIMASVPRTGPKAGAPPPGTQPGALLHFMPAVSPPTPGPCMLPGMLPGMIPQMPGFQPGQPGKIPQTPLPMFPMQAAICCPHCTGPVWLSVDTNGNVTSQAITLASASSTAWTIARGRRAKHVGQRLRQNQCLQQRVGGPSSLRVGLRDGFQVGRAVAEAAQGDLTLTTLCSFA